MIQTYLYEKTDYLIIQFMYYVFVATYYNLDRKRAVAYDNPFIIVVMNPDSLDEMRVVIYKT